METKVLHRTSTRFGVMCTKAALLTGLFVAMMILTRGHAHSEQTPTIMPVKSSEVCMVTDRVMGRPQIPVEVDGKVYYGCCQGCKRRLKNDVNLRFATDPLTGRRVDKAKAVIIEGTRGEALYFESIDTAMRYRVSAAKEEKQQKP